MIYSGISMAIFPWLKLPDNQVAISSLYGHVSLVRSCSSGAPKATMVITHEISSRGQRIPSGFNTNGGSPPSHHGPVEQYASSWVIHDDWMIWGIHFRKPSSTAILDHFPAGFPMGFPHRFPHRPSDRTLLQRAPLALGLWHSGENARSFQGIRIDHMGGLKSISVASPPKYPCKMMIVHSFLYVYQRQWKILVNIIIHKSLPQKPWWM